MRSLRVLLVNKPGKNETSACRQLEIDDSNIINNYSENQHKAGVAALDTASPVFLFDTAILNYKKFFMSYSTIPTNLSQALVNSKNTNASMLRNIRKMFMYCLMMGLFVMGGKMSYAQVPILYYDFENNTTRTTFENLVEQSINTGSGALTRAGNTTTVSGVGGAGTFNSGVAAGQGITSSNWSSSTTDQGVSATDYFQFVVNTSGFAGISISFDNQASATGPARVGILYSTDGSTFNIASTAPILTGNAAFSAASNFLLPIGADNQSSVTIRVYTYAGSAGDRTGRSAFGSGGTFRIDNLTVSATTETTSKTLLNYPNVGLSIKSGTAFTPIYANFEVSSTAQATCPSAITFSGTLSVGGSAAFIAAGILTNNGTATISGNFQLNQGGSVSGNALSYGASSTLTYAGTSAQTVSTNEFPFGAGAPVNLTVNNPAGVTLGITRAIAGGNLTLTDGDLNIASGAALVMSGGSITGTGARSITGSGGIAATSNPTTISSALSSLTIDGTSFLSTSSVLTNNTTLNINGSFVMQAGASAGGNPFVYGSVSSLTYLGNSPQTSSNVEFPGTNGPSSLHISNSGGVTLHAARSITNLELYSGVFSNGANLSIKNGGSITRQASSSLASAVTFEGTVSVFYPNQAAMTTGFEIPSSSSALTALDMTNSLVNVTAGSDIVINGTLTFYISNLILGNRNVTANSITRTAAAGYVVTDGTGTLTLKSVGATPKIFYIGNSNSSYTPITISNGGGDDFTVRVKPTFTNAPFDPTKVVNLEWIITKTGSQTGNNVTLTPQWNASNEAGNPSPTFNRAAALKLGHYSGTSWDEITAGAVSGAGPYTTTVTGISSFSPFGVGNTNAFVAACIGPSISGQPLATQTVCQNGIPTDLTVAATGDGLSYQWFRDDDGIGNDETTSVASTQIFTPPTGATGTAKYFCKVTGTCGTAYSNYATVIVNAVSVNSTQTNILCYGESTGAINITVSGGTSPYTFAWTGTGVNVNAEDQTGLAAGNYSVVVTDFNGCSAPSYPVTLTQPAVALSCSAVETSPASCGGANGSATVNGAGGAGGYTYLWDNSATGSTAIALSAGLHSVTVTDANGCTSNCSVTISTATAPEINVQGNSATIADGDNTPSLTDHTDFGSVNVGNNLVRTYTIQNTGSANLTVNSISIGGADAAMFAAGTLTPSSPIATGNSATFSVTFAPTSGGLKSATVNINSNDCDEAIYDFAVQGTGISPATDCDIATSPITVRNAANTANITSICVGQQANFRFSVSNAGTSGCTIPVGSVVAVLDFPTLAGPVKPYIYNGPASFNTTYFTWAYNSIDEVLEGTNHTAIPAGAVDADILVPVLGNAAGTGNSNINLTQLGATADNVGNNNATAQLTVNALPVVTCPANFTVCPNTPAFALSGGSPGGGTYSGSFVSAGQFDPVAAGNGPHTVVYSYTGPNGCSASCSFIITVADNTPPLITCPSTQVFMLNSSCGGSLGDYTSMAITSDNCPGTITVTQLPAPGSSMSGVGTTIVTLTAMDANGNTASCTFNVNRVDQTPPSISCPSTQTLVLDASCSASLPDYTSLAITNDNCGGVTVTQSPAPGTIVSGVGITVVTLTATDGSSNTSSCNFNVSRVDQTPPSISCPPTQLLVLDGSCSASLSDYTSLAIASDNCGGVTVSQLPTPGTIVSGVGTTVVTLTATDGSSNTSSCSFNVSRVDQTPPSITCPPTQLLVLDGSCSASLPDYTSLAIASDNCGSVTVTQSPAPGTIVSGVGTTVVTLIATDGSSNTASCSFNVNKVDQTPPSISCPSTQTLVLNASCSALLPDYTALAIASDNCGAVTVTQSPAPGTTVSGVGTTVVTLTATDGSSNTASCSFDVSRVDQTPPSISCPSTQTLVLDAGCSGTLADYTSLAIASDNCGSVTVIQSPAPGTSVSGVGTTVVTLTATDGSSNTASCSFNVNRVDQTPPSISCPSAQTLVLDASCSASLPDYTSLAIASDNCGGVIVTQSPSPGTIVSGVGITVVTLTATDASSNTASCSFNVNRVDQTPPSISCPVTQILVLNSSCAGTLSDYTSLAIASDNCSSVTVSQLPAPGSGVSGVGITVITLTAQDASGNTTSCTFNVSRVDQTPPSFTFCPSPVTNAPVNAAGCKGSVVTTQPTVADNCGLAKLEWALTGATTDASPNTGMNYLPSPYLFNAGLTTVTYTATDASGNTSTCIFTVNVVNTLSASVSGTTTVTQGPTTSSVTFGGTGGTLPYTFTYNVNGGSNQTISTTGANTTAVVQQSNAATGTFTYTLVSVTDANGCTGSLGNATATITVVPGPPDLFSTIDRPLNTQFTNGGPNGEKEGYVTISNAAVDPTTGAITFRIAIPNNFTLTLLPGTTTSAGSAVNNGDWNITMPTLFYYELTSKPAVVINGSLAFARIGFKLTATGTPNTTGIMTVSIINGTGGATVSTGDSNNSNNQSVKLFTIN